MDYYKFVRKKVKHNKMHKKVLNKFKKKIKFKKIYSKKNFEKVKL
jgi:hypothetical protein